MNMEIEMTPFVYRPCLANGEKALFHRWFEDSLITLKCDAIITSIDQVHLYDDWEDTHVLPAGVEQVSEKILRGLVELKNGHTKSVSPNDIIFLDTENYMHDQGISFTDEWIDHVKGE